MVVQAFALDYVRQGKSTLAQPPR